MRGEDPFAKPKKNLDDSDYSSTSSSGQSSSGVKSE